MRMGIFSELFKSGDKAQNRTTGATKFFLGGTTSGKTVTERSAIQIFPHPYSVEDGSKHKGADISRVHDPQSHDGSIRQFCACRNKLKNATNPENRPILVCSPGSLGFTKCHDIYVYAVMSDPRLK